MGFKLLPLLKGGLDWKLRSPAAGHHELLLEFHSLLLQNCRNRAVHFCSLAKLYSLSKHKWTTCVSSLLCCAAQTVTCDTKLRDQCKGTTCNRWDTIFLLKKNAIKAFFHDIYNFWLLFVFTIREFPLWISNRMHFEQKKHTVETDQYWILLTQIATLDRSCHLLINSNNYWTKIYK